eukprot:SM000165S02206  [mRNA]  locus=s165:102031:106956:- [translate_table: standard]
MWALPAATAAADAPPPELRRAWKVELGFRTLSSNPAKCASFLIPCLARPPRWFWRQAHDAPVAAMAVDASGGLLATGAGGRGGVRVWDTARGFCTHAFAGHASVVSALLFHPDPHRLLLLSGGEDGAVRVWDLVGRACSAVLEKHFSAVTGLAFDGPGRTLLSAARDKVVNVWSARDWSLEVTVPVFEAVEGVLALPDGCGLPGSQPAATSPATAAKRSKKKGAIRFLTVGEKGAIRCWQADSGKCVYEQPVTGMEAPHGDAGGQGEAAVTLRGLASVAMMPGNRGLLCATQDQRLLILEVDQDGKAFMLSRQLIGFLDEIVDLRFVGAGNEYLAAATNSDQVRVYDLSELSCRQSLVGHSDTVLAIDASTSNTGYALLATASKDHSVRVWDCESGRCLAVGSGHMGAVGGVAFARRKPSFLVSGSSDRTLKVWSLDGVLDAKGSGGDHVGPLKLASRATTAAHDKDINAVAVSPNDALACSGSQDRTARVWRLPELAPGVVLRGHKRGVWCVEFSPVDQAVLTASGDKTLRIWSLADGACLRTLEGHSGSVLKAAFVSHGTQVVSAGADGLLKLWTVRSSECLGTFDHHDDRVWALAVAADGEMLASGGSDALINIWSDCTVEEAEEVARKEEEAILKDQDLSNALAAADYVHAVQLAFELRRPYKMLSVFSQLIGSGVAEAGLKAVVAPLVPDQLRVLLEYVREWNTNAKYCHTAQRVLAAVLGHHSPARLLEVHGLQEVLAGLQPYTQRHFARIDRLERSTFLLDYTLGAMAVLVPEAPPPSAADLLRARGLLRPAKAPNRRARRAASRQAAAIEQPEADGGPHGEDHSDGELAAADGLTMEAGDAPEPAENVAVEAVPLSGGVEQAGELDHDSAQRAPADDAEMPAGAQVDAAPPPRRRRRTAAAAAANGRAGLELRRSPAAKRPLPRPRVKQKPAEG